MLPMMKALTPSLISTQSGVSSAESDAPAGSPELQPPEKNTLRRRLIGNATMATGSALGTNAWRRTASTRPLDAPLTKVFLTGKEKKPEVNEKRVYRISRKIIGFAILISDEI